MGKWVIEKCRTVLSNSENYPITNLPIYPILLHFLPAASTLFVGSAPCQVISAVGP